MAGSETPSRMKNEDFKKLLATPRASEPQTPSRFAKYDPNYVPDFKKPDMPAPVEKKKKKFTPRKVEEKTHVAAGYVDRAAARRDGKLDVDEEVEGLSTMNIVSAEEIKNLSDAERRALEIDRSKFFGGSEATTHMVKGLDYALLAKIKEDLAKKEREAEQQAKAEQRASESDKAGGYSRLISTDGTAHEIESVTDFKTYIGKSVFDVIFRKPSDAVDHFLPGRTSFVFDLDPDSMTDIPTIVKRSKDDIPVGRDLMMPVTHPELMHKITAIMVYFHQGAKAYKKLRKRQKKEKEETEHQNETQTAASDAMDIDNDNIFGDVSMSGVYIPKVASNVDDYDSKYESKPQSLLHLSTAKPQVNKEELERERLEKLMAQNDDGYAEAYPSAYEGLSFAAIDEDADEDDLLKMDTRQNLKRHEFESDEAWAAHQAEREATPKAAFQFGLKKKDGRQKKAFTEQKLKKQLRAVGDMIEAKQGHKITGFEDDKDAMDIDRPAPKSRKERAWEDTSKNAPVDTNSYESRLAQKRKASDGVVEESPSKKSRYDS